MPDRLAAGSPSLGKNVIFGYSAVLATRRVAQLV